MCVCVWQIILKGETPKLIPVAQKIEKQLHCFHSVSSEYKVMEMFSWPFSNWMFHSALFDHRKASCCYRKDGDRRDPLLYVTAA